jgi:CubicO group peptidase (beta-lactamase class C family)
MRVYLLLLIMLLAPAPAAAASLAQKLDPALMRLHRQNDFSGAVAITRKGRLVYARGFGLADIEKAVPFTPATHSDGASLTKPVTAAAIFLLVEDGLISLDAPIQKYVREYPHSQTTVRDLLSHSGGLPDYGHFQAMLDSGKPVFTVDLLNALGAQKQPPQFPPGTAFGYCNLCLDALALAVERVTGQSFEAFARRRLLGPAGAGTAFVRPARFADWNGVRTRGYRRGTSGWESNDAFDNEGFYGGDNIYFSALELASWAGAWAMESETLSRIRAAATMPAVIGSGQSQLSLGNWYCTRERDRCYYRGHHQGFHSLAYWDSKRRISVAFVSNNTLAPYLHTELTRSLIAAAEGGRFSLPAATPAAAATTAQLSGEYSFDSIGRVSIEADAASATILPPGGVRYRLFPIGQGWFYVPGLDAYLLRPATGAGLQWHSVFTRSVGTRVR